MFQHSLSRTAVMSRRWYNCPNELFRQLDLLNLVPFYKNAMQVPGTLDVYSMMNLCRQTNSGETRNWQTFANICFLGCYMKSVNVILLQSDNLLFPNHLKDLLVKTLRCKELTQWNAMWSKQLKPLRLFWKKYSNVGADTSFCVLYFSVFRNKIFVSFVCVSCWSSSFCKKTKKKEPLLFAWKSP